MSALYQITNDYQALVDSISGTDEINEQQLAELELITGSIQDKAINIAAFIKNLEFEADGIENAAKNMMDRHVKITKKIDNLKNYLKLNLISCNIDKINSPYFDIKIKHNPPSVKIDNPSLIPGKYIQEIKTYKMDKRLILEELKNNISIPGVSMKNGTRIEIK